MDYFNIIFIFLIIVFVLIFIFAILTFVSPKFRGKMMSRQIKSLKYMTEYSKDDLTDLGEASININSSILNNNEDKLKDIADKTANISKDAIKTTVSAIKNGIKDNIYCKHCGEVIDSDSKFCKYCGREQ